MNPKVDAFIERSQAWTAEMTELRSVLLGCGLNEQIKWGKPCYDHSGRNIAIMQPMKDMLSLMFFTGALIADPEGVLEDQGPNSRSARRVRLTSRDDVIRLRETLTGLVAEAIRAENAGVTASPAPEPDHVPELMARLDDDPQLRAAFTALTPGRRREYHLHFSGAKGSATRASRIERCVPLILAGKGMRDR